MRFRNPELTQASTLNDPFPVVTFIQPINTGESSLLGNQKKKKKYPLFGSIYTKNCILPHGPEVESLGNGVNSSGHGSTAFSINHSAVRRYTYARVRTKVYDVCRHKVSLPPGNPPSLSSRHSTPGVGMMYEML